MIRSEPVLSTIARASLLLCLAAPAIASAHELVDEGQRLYEEADFVAALDALARAEAATDLSLEDLTHLFETRALVHLAMNNADAMRADLRRLAAVAPDHRLPRTVPPDVVRAFAEIRAEGGGALRVLATTDASSAGVTITVRVDNDAAEIVRAVRTFGRIAGGEYLRAQDAPLLVPGSGVVEYYAEAIGPGGVVLARSGSADAPLSAAGRGGGDEAWPWVLVGVGVAVVAAVVITVVLLTTQPSGQAQTVVSPFTVRF